MSDLHVAGTYTTLPQPWATLWYCNHCNALVSIQSVKSVDEAFCPACAQAPLEFCGRFSGIPGLQLGDA
jgi:uncharacterized paraquat-inducible protein A